MIPYLIIAFGFGLFGGGLIEHVVDSPSGPPRGGLACLAGIVVLVVVAIFVLGKLSIT